MTWEPSDALVEKAARAMFDRSSWGKEAWDNHLARAIYRDSARAALLACRDDLVAEAVRAEAEACADLADKAIAVVEAMRAATHSTQLKVRLGLGVSAREIRDAIRARHP